MVWRSIRICCSCHFILKCTQMPLVQKGTRAGEGARAGTQSQLSSVSSCSFPVTTFADLFCCLFELRSYSVCQAVLEFVILPQPPKCWN
jgi:hypothetical protein